MEKFPNFMYTHTHTSTHPLKKIIVVACIPLLRNIHLQCIYSLMNFYMCIHSCNQHMDQDIEHSGTPRFSWNPFFINIACDACSVASVVSDSLGPYGLQSTRLLWLEILQPRILLQWVGILSSRGSSWPRDRTHVSCISCVAGGSFTTEPLGRGSPKYWLTPANFKNHIICIYVLKVKTCTNPSPCESYVMFTWTWGEKNPLNVFLYTLKYKNMLDHKYTHIV